MLTEEEGCALLKKIFQARGFTIAEHILFQEGSVSFTVDGWDASARVGYEYMTHASKDHDDLQPHELKELVGRMEKGELFIFVINESAEPDELEWAANKFLDEVAKRRAARSGT